MTQDNPVLPDNTVLPENTVLPVVRDVFAGPGPVIHPETAPFWSALSEGRFLVQRCRGCGTRRFPLAPACYVCLSFDFDWEPLARAGRVHVTVLVSRASGRWDGAVPFTAGLVNMDHGIRLPGRVLCRCGAGTSPGAAVALCAVPDADGGHVFAFTHDCWQG